LDNEFDKLSNTSNHFPKTTPTQTKINQLHTNQDHIKKIVTTNNYNLFNKLLNYYGYNAMHHGLDRSR
ncbi:TPA: hypothetical protein ACQFK9_003143, partial [Proteus mirabilis]